MTPTLCSLHYLTHLSVSLDGSRRQGGWPEHGLWRVFTSTQVKSCHGRFWMVCMNVREEVDRCGHGCGWRWAHGLDVPCGILGRLIWLVWSRLEYITGGRDDILQLEVYCMIESLNLAADLQEIHGPEECVKLTLKYIIIKVEAE